MKPINDPIIWVNDDEERDDEFDEDGDQDWDDEKDEDLVEVFGL